MKRGGLLALIVAGLAACQQPATAAAPEKAVLAPVPARVAKEGAGLKTAIFSGGCYWGVEAVFSHVIGVTSAVSGFQGGARGTAEYERVSSGTTGHAESVKVTYDPSKVRYDQLLQVFFSVIADPTELNRQGPDVGPQYRSAIFPADARQAEVARAYIAQLNAAHVFAAPIATTIEPDRPFYRAEDYHQDYLTRHPEQPYIAINDLPKIDELKRLFPDRYRAAPVLVSAARPAR